MLSCSIYRTSVPVDVLGMFYNSTSQVIKSNSAPIIPFVLLPSLDYGIEHRSTLVLKLAELQLNEDTQTTIPHEAQSLKPENNDKM